MRNIRLMLLIFLAPLLACVFSCQPETDINQTMSEAIQAGDLNTVESLLEQGADVDFKPADQGLQYTPLHQAVISGHPEIIRLLADRNASFTVTDHNGYTPVHTAVIQKQEECLEILISLGAPLDLPGSLCGNPPLFYAVTDDQSETASLLIENGCDVNFVNEEGDSLLHKAAFYGYSYVCRVLIDNGADPLKKNEAGQTSVDVAREFDEKECLQILTGEKD